MVAGLEVACSLLYIVYKKLADGRFFALKCFHKEVYSRAFVLVDVYLFGFLDFVLDVLGFFDWLVVGL